MRIGNHNFLYVESMILASAIPSCPDGQPTGKSLLDIDHLPGACLHESTIPSSRPFQPLLTRYLPDIFQIALVTGNNLDGLHSTRIMPMLALHVNHLQEIIQGGERIDISDVVNKQEGIGAQIRGCP